MKKLECEVQLVVYWFLMYLILGYLHLYSYISSSFDSQCCCWKKVDWLHCNISSTLTWIDFSWYFRSRWACRMVISVAIHYHQGFDNYRLHTRKKEERDVLWNRNIRKTQLYTLREADYRLCPNLTFIIPNYKNNVTCNRIYDVYHKQIESTKTDYMILLWDWNE